MPFELIKPGTKIDFVRFAKPCAIASVVLILAGLIAIPINGVRLGIDFAGGTEMQVRFDEAVTVDEGSIRGVVSALDVQDLSVVRFGGGEKNEFLIRFMRDVEGDKGEFIESVSSSITEGVGAHSVDRVEFVGPKVGAELRDDGLQAMGLAGLMVLIYITFRFSMRFAPGAIAAILHDVLVTAGIWVMFSQDFDLKVLAALLAIVGYSLNDTIIVFDRIRENMEIHTKRDLPDVINRSINQMLGRTILTSGTTMIAVLTLLLLGGEVIRPFAVTMAIGIVVGTYSSVYIAAPTLLILERWAGQPSSSGANSGRSGGTSGGTSGGKTGGKSRGKAGGKAARKAARA